MKPILKWVGGKQKIIQQLLDNVPNNFNTYYEPFLGSGTLFFALEPKKAVIGDINLELINFYKILAYCPDSLIFHLGLYENTREFYYKTRNLDRVSYYKIMDRVEKAARFLYLNKTCFNGLYRVNKKGQFNVPYGNYDYKNKEYYDKELLIEAGDFIASNNISIAGGDYQHITRNISEGDFIYLDPPYYNSYNQYNPDVFKDYRHLQLKRFVDYCTEKNIKVMLSNSDDEYIRKIYSEYTIKTISLKRSVNPNSKNKKTTELLIVNY